MDWHTIRRIPRTDGALVLLDIPDIRQREDWDCGAAAVEAVLRYHRVWRARDRDLTNPVQGMDPGTVAAVLRSNGMTLLDGTMTVEDLRHLTRTNRPVLCPVNLYGGHWVVCRGVEYGGVHFHCPTQGRLRLPVSRWVEEWTSSSESGHAFDRWGICPSR